MEISLKDVALASSKLDNKKSINLIEQRSNNTNEDTDKSLNLKISVKSKYILRKILLSLGEKRKLLLLKYNKYYHKLMGINIHNYQKLSGKIKIGGINGYGKEYGYDEFNLLFKGYYMNGKRNGKGKEYEGDKIFEGEYKNGIKNGKGIEYNKHGILFVGEYLNGKRWNGIAKEFIDVYDIIKFYGQYCEGLKIGREYDIDGQLIFEGKYLDDKKWNGIIYDNGILYPIKNGNGKVKEYSQDGQLIFIGNYINGDKNGKQYDFKGDLVFEGEYCNGKKWNGKIMKYEKKRKRYPRCGNCCCWDFGRRCKGIIRDNNIIEKLKKYKNIIKYEGEFLNGERNGKGKEYDINGKLKFEGEYLNDNIKNKKNKYNNYYNNNEYLLVLEGYLKNGLKDGLIKEYSSLELEKNYDYLLYENEENEENNENNENLLFIGEYKNDLRNGKGKEFDENNGKLIFEGEYLNGKRWNGIYKQYNFNLITFEGEYLNGNKKGKKYDNNGQLIFEGEYLDDKILNGKGKEFDYKGNLIFEGEFLNGKIWEGIIYNKEEKLEFQIKNGNGKAKTCIFYEDKKIIFEGEYINGEKNGIEKEFNSYNDLKFERQYLNGKLHGKILEYGFSYTFNKDIVIFEKEYLNGNINGKCKHFDRDTGKLIFEGEYLNGKLNGKAKEYNCYEQLIFDGEYFNNKKWNGKVKEYNDSDSILFEGEYLNGEKNGIGREYKENKLIYKGEYSFGEKHGKGKEYYDNCKLKFEGEYQYGLRWNGNMYNYNNEFLFKLVNGNGIGKEYNFCGELEYEGEFREGERIGLGKEYNQDEIIFEGEFLNGKRWNGIIKECNRNELVYEGEYKNGEKDGKGKEYEKYSNRLIYEGTYLIGKRHGEGKEYYTSREIYEEFYDYLKK